MRTSRLILGSEAGSIADLAIFMGLRVYSDLNLVRLVPGSVFVPTNAYWFNMLIHSNLLILWRAQAAGTKFRTFQ